ncbi:prolyl hydroxylase family protein [Paraburkholderia sp. RL17-337-BIB-A]|uniref:prolyl hydroxylase family protein n=1 Tax=Paraburkholderia sp. RL17-337-BIB-A TaxID=3031636 RepID=UPI0038B86884
MANGFIAATHEAEQEPREILSTTPRLILYRSIVAAMDAQSIIDSAVPLLRPALVSGENGGVQKDGRSAQSAWLPHDANASVAKVVEAISGLVGLDSTRAEQLHVIRYRRGDEYREHLDGYDMNTERGRRCTKSRGQRLITALLYMNEGFIGGQTVFPKLGVAVTPTQGSVLIFENCMSDTLTPDTRALHAGRPIQNGEKWLATLWYRES